MQAQDRVAALKMCTLGIHLIVCGCVTHQWSGTVTVAPAYLQKDIQM